MVERIFCTAIDISFYVAVFSFFSVVFTGEFDNLPEPVTWIFLCLYVVFFHCYLNRTPGMIAIGLRYVDYEFKKPIWWKMILRCIASFIFPLILIGALIAVLTFSQESGFYWDRWFKVRMIRINNNLFY